MQQKEAMFYTPVYNGVRCDLCARRCIITEGREGVCRVRKNINGKLYTEDYGSVAINFVDSIEKKAQYHFNPGAMTCSYGTSSCNFRCKFCINPSLSMGKIANVAGVRFFL